MQSNKCVTDLIVQKTSGVASLQPVATLAYLCDRLLQRIKLGRLHRYVFLRQPVENLPDMPRGFTSRPVAGDEPVMSLIEPSAEVRQYRYNQAAVCLAAFRGVELVGSLWLVSGQFVEDEVRACYKLTDQLSWDMGLKIPPAYRSGRAFQALWAGAKAYLQAQGKTATFSRIADNNMASLKSHARMGSDIIGSAIFVSLGRLQITVSTQLDGFPASVSMLNNAEFRFDK